jgi:hypothetical protein
MIITRLALGLSFFLLTACSSSVFMPYPVRGAHYQQAIGTQQLQAAIKETQTQTNSSRDGLLALLELGRLQQLNKDYTASQHSFALAFSKLETIDNRAVLSLSHTANQSGSLVTNDNVIPYQSYPYERIFAHYYQTLNYIALNKREAAQVETRRMQFLQNQAQQQEPTENHSLSQDALDAYQQRLNNTEQLAQRVTSSRQNAAPLYLSGVLYETNKQFDDALIDYKRALNLAPDNRFLQEDVMRLARQLKRSDEFTHLAKIATNPPKNNEGTVVIFYEEGFVPAKQELFLPFPWPDAWYTVAFPYYGTSWQSPQALSIEHTSFKAPLNSQVLTDTQALAARALKDNYVSMLVRQTLRSQTKHQMQKQAQDKGGVALGLLVGAYNFLSENADLRSWLTLPRFVHIARFNLPKGEQTLTLNHQKALTLTINSQQIHLVYVVNANNQYYISNWTL